MREHRAGQVREHGAGQAKWYKQDIWTPVDRWRVLSTRLGIKPPAPTPGALFPGPEGQTGTRVR